ncbi:ABC transporter permease [Macrococcoides canis]|uniref:ABC transporter permease n=1 Tax=Macrococcoides canis TaxID=1855823 RepID=UPI001AEC4D99|nr:ABC transporter permease [Macrococcus canis]QTQ08946.1 ABC transporter permease [Macrococcus canis]
MKTVYQVIQEQLNHFELIYKLAVYNLKSQYTNHYLGAFWNFLQPAMQVLLYYVVFGLGLRGAHSDIDGVPFIVYLISGLFPWLFISQSINAGASAIQSQIGLVTKMKFPSSTLLSISFTNALINLIITSSIIFVISLGMQLVPLWHYLFLIYFIFSSYVLLFGISLLMSTLVILIRDTKNLLQNLIRMGFFLTPIFWSVSHTSHIMLVISKLNPFSYLLGYYRLALINGNIHSYGNLYDHIYFWSITLIILLIGSKVHMKFRNKLVDYL